MNWPWSGLNRVATGHQHDSGSGEIRQRAKCNITALVSAQIGTTRSACRAHLWRSDAPPAPGCRRRRAARGRALPPTARCSLQRVTPRGGEWRLAMKQSHCAGRCKQVHTGPAKARQVTARANVPTQKRRSKGKQSSAEHLAGMCGRPAFRWGRPGPSAAATASPRGSCWQTVFKGGGGSQQVQCRAQHITNGWGSVNACAKQQGCTESSMSQLVISCIHAFKLCIAAPSPALPTEAAAQQPTSRLAMCQSNSLRALAAAWGSPPPASASSPPL